MIFGTSVLKPGTEPRIIEIEHGATPGFDGTGHPCDSGDLVMVDAGDASAIKPVLNNTSADTVALGWVVGPVPSSSATYPNRGYVIAGDDNNIVLMPFRMTSGQPAVGAAYGLGGATGTQYVDCDDTTDTPFVCVKVETDWSVARSEAFPGGAPIGTTPAQNTVASGTESGKYTMWVKLKSTYKHASI